MAKSKNSQKHSKEKPNRKAQKQQTNSNKCQSKDLQNKPHSWAVVRSLFTCKHLQAQIEQQQQKQKQQQKQEEEEEVVQQEKQNVQPRKAKVQQKQPIEEPNKKSKKMRCSGSICNNTKVMQRPEHSSSSSSPEEHKRKYTFSSSSSCKNVSGSTSRSMKITLNDINNTTTATAPSSSPSIVGSFKATPFRKLSGCYECRMVVDPVLGMTRDPSLRTTICSCPVCGEIFMKPDSLELHQSLRHAVSELGPEDTSRNIVEIIFQSSWLKKDTPICKIERILKVHNTPRTLSRFEEYRESTKSKANKQPKKHPRCIADGNELLRFHCTTFVCSLGLNGSSNLCNSIPDCRVCDIIKNGFKVAEDVVGPAGKGILTTATSGKAHDSAGEEWAHQKRAMLVCRVIAGRVKKCSEGSVEEYDSVAGTAGVYSNLDELYVFNHRAILPCFVVIYREF